MGNDGRDSTLGCQGLKVDSIVECDFRLMRSPSAVSSVFRVPFGLSPTPTLHPFRGNFRVGGHSLRTPNPVRQDEHHFGFGSLVQRRTHQSETGRKRLANHWEAKENACSLWCPTCMQIRVILSRSGRVLLYATHQCVHRTWLHSRSLWVATHSKQGRRCRATLLQRGTPGMARPNTQNNRCGRLLI